MLADFYNYTLPEARIAQRPAGLTAKRSSAKLLHARAILSGDSVSIQDVTVSNLPSLLRSGDLLVLNNSKVIPCRFFVQRESSSGKISEIEVLLVHPLSEPVGQAKSEQFWEALARPMRKLKSGEILQLGQKLKAEVSGRTEDGSRLRLRVFTDEQGQEISKCIATEGRMPIPPYIRKGRSDEQDRELYQTVFAEIPGSVAAPTAGLHFTEEIFSDLEQRNISREYITLHVGAASFLSAENQQTMSPDVRIERYCIPKRTVDAVRNAKQEGRRVVAVGTTVVRSLESWALQAGAFGEGEEWSETNLFITPGYQFQVVDALCTNFHQPGSTHLQLVAAFFGEEAIAKVYQHALKGRYRFLSYGDTMFLEKESQDGVDREREVCCDYE